VNRKLQSQYKFHSAWQQHFAEQPEINRNFATLFFTGGSPRLQRLATTAPLGGGAIGEGIALRSIRVGMLAAAFAGGIEILTGLQVL